MIDYELLVSYISIYLLLSRLSCSIWSSLNCSSNCCLIVAPVVISCCCCCCCCMFAACPDHSNFLLRYLAKKAINMPSTNPMINDQASNAKFTSGMVQSVYRTKSNLVAIFIASSLSRDHNYET